jgi:hypothetical protein
MDKPQLRLQTHRHQSPNKHARQNRKGTSHEGFSNLSCSNNLLREHFAKFFISLQYINLLELNCLSEENIVQVGHITHFFSKINVAVLELTAPLAVGDRILVKGPSTDFEQAVESMQIEHKNIQKAEAGQSVGLKTAQHAKERDIVYKKI